jgi:hypothetical protein
MADRPDEPRDDPPPIEYYAANAPGPNSEPPLPIPGSGWPGMLLLVLGWASFVAGAIGLWLFPRFAPNSWLTANNNGAVVLMLFGSISTIGAMFAFIFTGHAEHVGHSGFSLILQIGISICLHGAR